MLVDVIQKCVILSASIADLYGGSAARDLYAAQPFSGGSVSQQQQHYYQTGASLSSAGPAGAAANNSNNPAALNTAYHNNGAHADNGTMQQQQQHQQAGSKLIRASGESGSSNDNGQINDNGSAVGQSASSLLASRSANEAAAQTSSSSSSPSTGQPASSNAPQSTLPSQVSRIVFQSQCTQTWSSSPSATSSPATQRTAIRIRSTQHNSAAPNSERLALQHTSGAELVFPFPLGAEPKNLARRARSASSSLSIQREQEEHQNWRPSALSIYPCECLFAMGRPSAKRARGRRVQSDSLLQNRLADKGIERAQLAIFRGIRTRSLKRSWRRLAEKKAPNVALMRRPLRQAHHQECDIENQTRRTRKGVYNSCTWDRRIDGISLL